MSVDFTLPDQDGQPFSSADHRGRKLIVFFYPAAMTPGCTAEACDFRDNYTALSQAGYDLVGISPDAPAKNARFKEKEGLNFPLLSDTDHKVAEQFGAWGPKMLYGKESVGLIRSTFVIDADGELEREFRNVKAKGHVARLTQELGVS
ncbi:MAG TPA: thioredoxin-dependent thiol peroxidase [Acidimicrobiia bacterium]|nr:thioredoxin-dependent thiol peroxidase [Acidimicrobiia bacterium]